MTFPLAVTMGDPAGIGPEIVVKALAAGTAHPCVVLGDRGVMEDAVRRYGEGARLVTVEAPEAAQSGTIALVETSHLERVPPLREVSAEAGGAAFEAIDAAIRFARAGAVAGIVTAPINKAALSLAGYGYPGHTEILADRGGGAKVAMMLANDDIRTVLVTIHCSLREAIERVDHAAVLDAIRLAHEGTHAFGIARPRVAVAGLNPHAGEDGLFGREEIDIIAPAIRAARAEGIDASGPWPGDTVFMLARAGEFDVVVAQYHDQGLIPVKYLGLERGVNITLGLPFVRTSPDHGTAFDIAGQGIADPTSLAVAIETAAKLAAARK